MKILIVATIFSLLLCSCVNRPIALVPSTSPLAPGTRGTEPVEDTNCQYFLLGLLPVSQPVSLAGALRRTKLQAHVDVLTDVTVEEEFRYYILYSSHCVRVTGLAVKK